MIQKAKKYTARLKALVASTACLATLSLTSCDSAIYDYEGDCEPHYRVNFVYDYNMKYADAFPHEVGSVTLRLIGADGKVVWQRTDDSEAVSQPGYYMDVDCPPGTYSLHVWAEGHEGESFELASSDADLLNMLTARLPRGEGGVSAERLRDLYHGYVASVTFPDTEGIHTHTVPLTKDTNYLRVVLQQTSGAPLDANDLEISITDDNGFLNPDNTPRQDEPITYKPIAVTQLKADIENKGMCDGVLAEFSLSRLMENHRPTSRLTVRSQDKEIFSVKLIDFLLTVKGIYYERLGDQEYLDRQDIWDLAFILDEDKQWLATYIYINAWRVVLQREDL